MPGPDLHADLGLPSVFSETPGETRKEKDPSPWGVSDFVGEAGSLIIYFFNPAVQNRMGCLRGGNEFLTLESFEQTVETHHQGGCRGSCLGSQVGAVSPRSSEESQKNFRAAVPMLG